ncbi:glycosyltransferase [Clostridium butyricum]|uniref:Glycosyltransferase n=1 Tax=Clostridium butyricum TaxID=1492 RepID=A0A6L9ERT3_CLOBU|nr:glycosyltransferase [Clostridium butyricum]
MNICAVVVTYNRKELLKECIESLLKQTYKLKRIVIVDNNSTDNTYDYLLENKLLSDKIVKYIKLQKNIGGAGGFNKGIEIACKDNEYDWIWMMDDDTIPNKDSLEQLLSGKNVISEKVSFLCSKVIGPENEEMNIPNLSRKIGENGYKEWMKYLNKAIVQVESATFVSVLINVEAIKKVGLPWKEFFIWGDDIEYTSRLSKYYGPGYVIGKSIVVHKRYNAKNITIIDEENENRVKFYKYKYRNDILIAKEYGELKNRVATVIFIPLRDIIKIIMSNSKYKMKKIILIITSVSNGILNVSLKNKFKNRMKVNSY